jgi:hypothetical protein
MATGQPSADASEASQSDASAACSLPSETCAGGCVAQGGTCVAAGFDCNGQRLQVCGTLYCCLPPIWCGCPPSNPGPPLEAGITPSGGPDASDAGDDGAPEAGSDGSDAAASCLAAGGECRPCNNPEFDVDTASGACFLNFNCAAIGFQNCGLGAACCLDVCDPDALVIRASSYDQTCAVDTDCTAVSEGSTCNACNFACPNAVISVNALPQYRSDTSSLLLAAANLCPSSCPAQGACCRGGTCHLVSPSDPTCAAQPVDSGADSGDAGTE